MKLTVVSSTQNEKKTAYVTKLKGSKVVDLGVLGTKEVDRHYYISAPNQVEKGTEVEINLGQFNIVEREFAYTDDDGVEQIAMLKWLHLK
jgi:hypothetical protein